MINAYEMVTIRNTGTKPLTLPWERDGRPPVIVAPGRTVSVPAVYALINFGDPSTPVEDREEELKQLRTRYGFYPGLMPDAAWTEQWFDRETKETRQPLCPQFEVHDQDGKRIYMLVEDQDGDLARSVGQEAIEHDEARFAQQELASTKAKVARLEALLRDQLGVSLDDDDADPAPALAPGVFGETVTTTTDVKNMDLTESQTSRNAQAANTPKPADDPVRKDGPAKAGK